MAIQEREADLVVATFGRALWVFDDIRPFRKLAANKGMAITNTITAFPAPEAYQAQFRPATGYDWSVNGLYEGENRTRGSEVSFFINKPKGETSQKDSLQTQQPGFGRTTRWRPPQRGWCRRSRSWARGSGRRQKRRQRKGENL